MTNASSHHRFASSMLGRDGKERARREEERRNIHGFVASLSTVMVIRLAESRKVMEAQVEERERWRADEERREESTHGSRGPMSFHIFCLHLRQLEDGDEDLLLGSPENDSGA